MFRFAIYQILFLFRIISQAQDPENHILSTRYHPYNETSIRKGKLNQNNFNILSSENLKTIDEFKETNNIGKANTEIKKVGCVNPINTEDDGIWYFDHNSENFDSIFSANFRSVEQAEEYLFNLIGRRTNKINCLNDGCGTFTRKKIQKSSQGLNSQAHYVCEKNINVDIKNVAEIFAFKNEHKLDLIIESYFKNFLNQDHLNMKFCEKTIFDIEKIFNNVEILYSKKKLNHFSELKKIFGLKNNAQTIKISHFIELYLYILNELVDENSEVEKYFNSLANELEGDLGIKNQKRIFLRIFKHPEMLELMAFVPQFYSFVSNISKICFNSKKDFIKAYFLTYLMFKYVKLSISKANLKKPKKTNSVSIFKFTNFIKEVILLDSLFYVFTNFLYNSFVFKKNALFIIYQSISQNSIEYLKFKPNSKIYTERFLTKNLFFSFQTVCFSKYIPDKLFETSEMNATKTFYIILMIKYAIKNEKSFMEGVILQHSDIFTFPGLRDLIQKQNHIDVTLLENLEFKMCLYPFNSYNSVMYYCYTLCPLQLINSRGFVYQIRQSIIQND